MEEDYPIFTYLYYYLHEYKKEEKISLSLSRDTLHVNGIKTATTKAEQKISLIIKQYIA